MNGVWAAGGVVLLMALATTLSLPAPVLATLSARHMVPPLGRHRPAPEPVVDLESAHRIHAKLKVSHESAVNPPVVPEPAVQHSVIPDPDANHKLVPGPKPMHKVVPESSSKHKVTPKLPTSNKVALEPEEKHTDVSGPRVEEKFADTLVIGRKVTPEPAVKLRIPGELRPEESENLPQVRPGLVRPGDEAASATTTVDSLTAFCQEACKEGKGGPECNCPGHPVGRRHAPVFTP